jgi:hypothetical protein
VCASCCRVAPSHHSAYAATPAIARQQHSRRNLPASTVSCSSPLQPPPPLSVIIGQRCFVTSLPSTHSIAAPSPNCTGSSPLCWSSHHRCWLVASSSPLAEQPLLFLSLPTSLCNGCAINDNNVCRFLSSLALSLLSISTDVESHGSDPGHSTYPHSFSLLASCHRQTPSSVPAVRHHRPSSCLPVISTPPVSSFSVCGPPTPTTNVFRASAPSPARSACWHRCTGT